MNCKIFGKYLDEYLNGTLSASKRKAFEEHAAGCINCRKLLDDGVSLNDKLKQQMTGKEPGGRHSFQSFSTKWENINSGVRNTLQPFEGAKMRRIIFVLAVLLILALATATVFAREYYNLSERLGDKDANVRSAAAVELSENVWNTQVYDILTQALDSDSPEVRAAAAESLGMIVKKSKGLSTKLLEMLSDKDFNVRMKALDALREVGFPAESVPVLMERLAGENSFSTSMLAHTVSEVARRNSIWMEQLVATLIDASKSGAEMERINAIGALGRIGPQPGVVNALMDTLHDDDYFIRAYAATALAQLGEEGKVAIPEIIQLIPKERPADFPTTTEEGKPLAPDSFEKYLGAITYTLSMFGPDAKDALPVLIEMYNSDDFDTGPPPQMPQFPGGHHGYVVTPRIAIVTALGNIGIASDEVISVLSDALQDDDPGLRQTAVHAVPHLGPEGVKLLPGLLDAIRDEDEFINGGAAMAIQKMGPAAKEAIPTLIDMLSNSDDEQLRENAITALCAMGREPGVIPALIKAMEDEDEGVRIAAIHAFRTIGTDDEDAVAAIYARLDDESDEVREEAANVLTESGKHFEPALDVMIDLLGNGYRYAGSVATTLGDLGPRAKRALPKLQEIVDGGPESDYLYCDALYAVASISGDVDGPLTILIDMLGNGDKTTRHGIIWNIGKLGPAAKKAIGVLIINLSNDDYQVRQSCVTALGNIGPDSESALSLLRALAENDESENVRTAAKEAIAKIESEE